MKKEIKEVIRRIKESAKRYELVGIDRLEKPDAPNIYIDALTLADEIERIDLDLHMAKVLLGGGVYTAGDKILQEDKG